MEFKDFKTLRAERAGILTYVKNSNTYSWQETRKIWVRFSEDGKNNIFSSVGIGARNAVFYVRRPHKITLLNAIKYRQCHYFITLIEDIDIMYSKVTAAKIEPVECSYKPVEYEKNEYNRPVKKEGEVISFTACLTEKYTGKEVQPVTAVSSTTYVFVTPKIIELKTGNVIKAKSLTWLIEKCHTLDRYKNEYEAITRSEV
ncbi:MAG: hypothetical protein LKJ25_01000 [Clostridia bacterium]|jgi:hypothetical protein|nr:hypothetical protein [Clostridia bacterium]